ncbi:MAG: hypothetical protein ACTTJ3_06235 [Treponema sp.]
MENTFTQELEGALVRRTEELNVTVLPFAFENYGVEITFVKIVRNLLLKKRLIHNDPYKYDSKMTEIEIPDSSPFMKTEAPSILGARLAHYETMLDFLMGYYQFNTNFLTPKRMQKLLALNATFAWSDFSPKSKSQNTVELYEIIAPIFSSSDKVSTTVLRGALSNLSIADRNIADCLKALLFFYRQKYKLSVRKELMPHVKPTNDDYLNPTKILKEIKKVFALKAKKLPFYADFVIEILKEDYSVDHRAYQEQVLQELFSKVKKEVEKEKKIEDVRPYLLLALQALGYTGSHFAKALEKTRENKSILDEANKTFFTKLVSFLRQAFNISEPPCEIPIIIQDSVTQVKKKYTLPWAEFEQKVISKAMFFASLSSQSESMKKKIRNAKEQDLVDVLNINLSDANELVSQLAGLDEYFKKEKPEIRSKIQGIKIELTTIKNYIIKSNQRRAEYLALCEEAQQMHDLGMDAPF